jgi:hypothetical protein
VQVLIDAMFRYNSRCHHNRKCTEALLKGKMEHFTARKEIILLARKYNTDKIFEISELATREP